MRVRWDLNKNGWFLLK